MVMCSSCTLTKIRDDPDVVKKMTWPTVADVLGDYSRQDPPRWDFGEGEND